MRSTPIEKASVMDLEPVLDEEASHFLGELSWDIQPALNIILQHVQARTLPGSVVRTSEGGCCGYEFHVSDGMVGFIGGLYVVDEFADPEVYSRLIDVALQGLAGHDRVQRIECQLFSFNTALVPLFEARGFKPHRRHFLRKELPSPPSQQAIRSEPPGIRLEPWRNSFLGSAASVVFQSYRDSVDRELCLDYQSSSGCCRFLRNLLGNPGCGRFNSDTSLVATDEEASVEGVLLASNISSTNGMIPQLSVRPEAQRKGLGTTLLHEHFRLAHAEGLRSVSLSVSEGNRDAVRLYERLGFRRVKDFHAFVWEGDPKVRRLAPEPKQPSTFRGSTTSVRGE